MIYILFGIFFNAARLIWESNQEPDRPRDVTIILFLSVILSVPFLIYPFFLYGLAGFKLLGWWFLGMVICGEFIAKKSKGMIERLFYLSPLFYIGLFFLRDLI